MTAKQKIIMGYLRGSRRFPIDSVELITNADAVRLPNQKKTFTVSADGNKILLDGRAVAFRSGAGAAWQEDILSYFRK